MPQPRLRAAVAALGLAVLLLTPRVTLGQTTGGYYYETFRYGYNPAYYARRFTKRPTGQTAKTIAASDMYLYYVAPPPVTQAQGGRPVRTATRVAAAESPVTPDTRAQIDQKVPQDAEVWFDGAKTTQTGSLRRFVTPPLTQGGKYGYEVRVVWKDGTRTVTETRRLELAAGESFSANFPTAVASATGAEPARPALSHDAGKESAASRVRSAAGPMPDSAPAR
jgi:uncharacterized protein (TIGR03000 family)